MNSLLKLHPNFKPSFDGVSIAQSLVNKVIGRGLPVTRAFLFGSSALQQNTFDSDVDILLVVPDSGNLKSYYDLVGEGFFSPVAVDWIILNESEYLSKKDLGGVAFIATHYGKSLTT